MDGKKRAILIVVLSWIVSVALMGFVVVWFVFRERPSAPPPMERHDIGHDIGHAYRLVVSLGLVWTLVTVLRRGVRPEWRSVLIWDLGVGAFVAFAFTLWPLGSLWGWWGGFSPKEAERFLDGFMMGVVGTVATAIVAYLTIKKGPA